MLTGERGTETLEEDTSSPQEEENFKSADLACQSAMTEREGIWRKEGMSDFSQEIEPAVALTVQAAFGNNKFPHSDFGTYLV